MKYSVKLAGVFASGVFIAMTTVAALTGKSSFAVLKVSLLGALVVGLIAYQLGAILAKPKGHPKPLRRKKSAHRTHEAVSNPDQTFLDDLDPMPEKEPS